MLATGTKTNVCHTRAPCEKHLDTIKSYLAETVKNKITTNVSFNLTNQLLIFTRLSTKFFNHNKQHWILLWILLLLSSVPLL